MKPQTSFETLVFDALHGCTGEQSKAHQEVMPLMKFLAVQIDNSALVDRTMHEYVRALIACALHVPLESVGDLLQEEVGEVLKNILDLSFAEKQMFARYHWLANGRLFAGGYDVQICPWVVQELAPRLRPDYAKRYFIVQAFGWDAEAFVNGLRDEIGARKYKQFVDTFGDAATEMMSLCSREL